MLPLIADSAAFFLLMLPQVPDARASLLIVYILNQDISYHNRIWKKNSIGILTIHLGVMLLLLGSAFLSFWV